MKRATRSSNMQLGCISSLGNMQLGCISSLGNMQLGCISSLGNMQLGCISSLGAVRPLATRTPAATIVVFLAAFFAACLAACSGETGTLSVTLTTAPGSTVLENVQTLELTLTTDPPQVTTAERTASGFSVALELEATGGSAALHVRGLDASGGLVANGASPAFPLGAINGRVVIYMAPPMSVGAAPLSLTPARSKLAAAQLPYGVIFAGGLLDSGAASDHVSVYNAFDHSLVAGLPLPEPRAGIAMAVGATNGAYMFGGFDDAGVATASLWRFDTTVPPNGVYVDFGPKEGFARGGELALPVGDEHYLITGAPIGELAGLSGAMALLDALPALPAAGATVTANDGMLATIFAGADGVVRFRNGTFTTLALPAAARADAAVVGLPGGKVIVVCGTTEAVRIDAASGSGESFTLPAAAKSGCAAAATGRHLIIAGGNIAGAVDGSVEIFDAATLAPVGSATLVVPRTGAVALALPNDQILIAGGLDAAGAPVGTLELFTPPVD